MAEYIEREALLEDVENSLVFSGRPDRPNPKHVGAKMVVQRIRCAPAADVAPVVRCRDCKHRNKQECPLVMVRFDMRPNGAIKKVLEQNYVDEEFWCRDGVKADGGDGNGI